MTISNRAIVLVFLVFFSGCGLKFGPETKDYVGKYIICSPYEYIQKDFPSQSTFTTLDSFSIAYYQAHEKIIRGSTLEIFSATTFFSDCKILSDATGNWEMKDGGDIVDYLKLTFSHADAAPNFHYEPQGYRIWVLPLSALKEKIPITTDGPRYLQLVYKKINSDALK